MQSDVAGYSCLSASDARRWARSPGHKPKHGMLVRDYYKECGFVGKESHPFPRKHALAPPTRIRGQENCRVPVFGEKGRGDAGGAFHRDKCGSDCPDANVQNSNKQHHLKSSRNYDLDDSRRVEDDPKPVDRADSRAEGDGNRHGSVNEASCSPQVPCGEHQQSCPQMSNATDGPSSKKRESGAWSKKSQKAVRDQIHRVVVELDKILHSLKEVHQEMKEVVQQIELLTSTIDLQEDEPCCGRSNGSSSGVVVGSHAWTGDEEGSRQCSSAPSCKSSPAPSHSSATSNRRLVDSKGKKCAQTSGQNPSRLTADVPCISDPPRICTSPNYQRTPTVRQRTKSDASQIAMTGPRSKKPPPYPHGARTERTGKGKESVKLPTCPVKRRLLSTTV
ncbi:uncharacterized protein LOC114802344 [Denticeps clupeoides]|uniref:uncharacterized protein LOC114802344 n=1 Tax=Denticeps clupeoides TaxID=299321 RepID=UPI0010A31125|nr:uncharacterized protein LOC114802344 [Denticeps clupeoides]